MALNEDVDQLRAKIEAEPSVFARIALYNDPEVPLAVRLLAVTSDEDDWANHEVHYDGEGS